MLKLIVDDREQHILPHLRKKKLSFALEVKRMYIGDYAIYRGDQLLCLIERKTWKDLSASICDGRKENIHKLLLAREKTGCKILYLIEGRARYHPMKKIGRIYYKSLQAHLDHLMFRDNISMIYSNNNEDTVFRIEELIQNISTLEISTLEIIPNKEEPPLDLCAKISKSDEQTELSIWKCISHITEKTAPLFIEAGIHIADLILGNISKEEISKLQYPSGAQIGKRADKIYKSSLMATTHIKMLTCLHGITKNTANIIVSQGFHRFLTGEITTQHLAEIKKTEKNKIGIKVAMRIEQHFIKKQCNTLSPQ